MLWRLFLEHLPPRPLRQAVSRRVFFRPAAEETA